MGSAPIMHGANALKLENEVMVEPVTSSTASEMMNEQTVTNSKIESIIEHNNIHDYEQSSSEENISNGLENFGVEGETAPVLFTPDNETEGLLSKETSENISEDDDLEIPAFLRRQKN